MKQKNKTVKTDAPIYIQVRTENKKSKQNRGGITFTERRLLDFSVARSSVLRVIDNGRFCNSCDNSIL